MKHCLCFILFSICAATIMAAGIGERYVILETTGNGETKVSAVGMDTAAPKTPFPPASTFKILITWAAMEEGLVTPETTHYCEDKYIPGTPRDVTLHDALYYSSNDYFVWLAKQLGEEKLRQYMILAEYADVPSGPWIGSDFRRVVGGGKIKVSPEQQHRFIQKVGSGKLASNPKFQKSLEDALTWPSSDKGIALYGKTGTYDGAVWYNGYAKKSDGTTTYVTIFMPYDLPNGIATRNKAISLFYSLFNQKFTAQ